MAIFDSERKVQKFGESLAITLPSMFRKASEIEKGHMMTVFYGLKGVLVATSEDVNTTLEQLQKIMNKLENWERLQKIEEEINEKRRKRVGI